VKHLVILCLLLGGCAAAPRSDVPLLGTARMSSDFTSYSLKRVGVLPPQGEGVAPDLAADLRDALSAAFGAETPYELVPLGAPELESISGLEPARTGRTRADSVLDLARRASLDAVLSTRVVGFRPYEPVRMGLAIDLVAVETGLSIWSCSVQVDTADRTTCEAIEAWQEGLRATTETERAADLVSPRRIGEFAALQAARLL
jgi:hypothetical protein